MESSEYSEELNNFMNECTITYYEDQELQKISEKKDKQLTKAQKKQKRRE